MIVGRTSSRVALALTAAVALAGFSAGCKRRQPAETIDVTPSLPVNRARAPLGSASEVTDTWTVGKNAKHIKQPHRAFVHFLDSHEVMLFTDDHVPSPPPDQWEA